MKAVQLTKGFEAAVDDDDYPLVSQYSWHAHITKHKTYARGFVNGKHVYMHRFIIPAGSLEVDHRDGNGLNNTRINLRPATKSQQGCGHRTPRAGKTSQYRGVSWCESDKRWTVRIIINKRSKFIGNFLSEEDAARAYDAAALQHYGEFATLNFQ